MKETKLIKYLISCKINFDAFVSFLRSEGCTITRLESGESFYHMEDILIFMQDQILLLKNNEKPFLNQ